MNENTYEIIALAGQNMNIARILEPGLFGKDKVSTLENTGFGKAIDGAVAVAVVQALISTFNNNGIVADFYMDNLAKNKDMTGIQQAIKAGLYEVSKSPDLLKKFNSEFNKYFTKELTLMTRSINTYCENTFGLDVSDLATLSAFERNKVARGSVRFSYRGQEYSVEVDRLVEVYKNPSKFTVALNHNKIPTKYPINLNLTTEQNSEVLYA